MLGKGILRELPLCGLENPLGDGDAVPRECSPSDALFFSGRRGGCKWDSCDFIGTSSVAKSSLSTLPFPNNDEAELGQSVP